MNTEQESAHPWTRTSRDSTLAALDRAESVRVLVVGDLMVDQYLLGRVERISPEAPVPVVSATQRERRLGGAANVALNLKALGCQVTLAGLVGDDDHGRHLQGQLQNAGIDGDGVATVKDRPTTLKTRVMSGGQHLLRVDEEVDRDVDATGAAALLSRIQSALASRPHHAILLEDYDKGALSESVIHSILDTAKAQCIPVCVDPKFRHFDLFKGVDLFKPNLKELKEGLGLQWELDDTKARDAGIRDGLDRLDALLRPKATLLTLSELGVRVRFDGQDAHHPAHPREILDVSGAGDTVIAVATMLLACGVAAPDLAAVSNLAGGLVCETPGVVPIDPEALRREIQRLPLPA